MKLFFTLLTGIILSLSISAQPKNRAFVANVFEFTGSVKNDSAKIAWKVSDNERGHLFEVEKSLDGMTFETSGIVFASDKPGIEEYEFKGIAQKEATAYYRLKIFNGSKASDYSKVIQLKNTPPAPASVIRLLNNHSESQIGFTYQSDAKGTADVFVYNMSGARVYAGRVFTYTGSNMVTLNMNAGIKRGIYILEVINGNERTAVKFVKG